MLIRRLFPHELHRFAAHLKGLSADDRRFRFAHATVSDASIDAYVAGIAAGDVVLAGLVGDDLAGAVHVALGASIAEIGVSVAAAYRGRGLGSDLFTRAVRWARNRGAVRLYTLCLGDNLAMAALARRHGMDLQRESGTAEATLPLPPPDLASVSDEVVQDWAALMRSCRGLWPGASRSPH